MLFLMQQRFSYIHQTINHIIHKTKIFVQLCHGGSTKTVTASSKFTRKYNIKGLSRANTKNETIKQPRDVKIGLIHR